MLALVYGSDGDARKKKRDLFISTIRKQHEGAVLVSITAPNVTQLFITETVFASDLFGTHRIIILSEPLQVPEFSGELSHVLENVQKRDDVSMLVIEEKLLKADVEFYKKYTKDITLCDAPKKDSPAKSFFTLSDAIVARDKKKVWSEYRKAIDAEASEEEIAGLIFWALKNLALVASGETAQEAGLHPFVYQKTKTGLQVWDTNDLQKALGALIATLHEGRRNGLDVGVALEQFVLKYL